MFHYKKYFTIPASPKEVYNALTNPLAIKLWTGEECNFTLEPNTEFSLWNDSIVGLNLEFEDGKKIVQEWYFGEQEDKSIVIIKLHEDKKGTSLEVQQTNIPEADFDNIKEGWQEVYIPSLIDFFDEGKA